MNHCVRNLYFYHWNSNAREICRKAYLITFQETRRKWYFRDPSSLSNRDAVVDKGEMCSNNKQNESLGSFGSGVLQQIVWRAGFGLIHSIRIY